MPSTEPPGRHRVVRRYLSSALWSAYPSAQAWRPTPPKMKGSLRWGIPRGCRLPFVSCPAQDNSRLRWLGKGASRTKVPAYAA